MENLNVNALLKSLFNEDKELNIKDLFEQKLLEYDLSKTKAFKLLSIDKDVFEEICNGTAKQPNLINIVKLAEFLERDINEFIGAVLKNQSSENIAAIAHTRKATFLLKHFDVKTLYKEGFFTNKDDVDYMISKVLSYFGYNTIDEYEMQLDEPLYSRVKRPFSDKMKDFWIKSAYQTFRIVNNPNPYNRNALKDIVLKLKPYSTDIKDGLLIVCKALYNAGVTVIFQNYLTTTHVRGATFAINGKPCIVITDYLKKYPTLWFTLLHELNHVLFDFETIEKNKFHLTGDPDLFLIEEKADAFARDFFMTEEMFHYIKMYINNAFMVKKFAQEHEVHVSMIYSFYTWYQDALYGNKYYAAFKEFYPPYVDAVRKLNPIQWNDVDIKTASDKIKQVLEIK